MDYSWLSPDGEVIEVGFFGFNIFAYDLLEKEMNLDSLNQFLEENNYSNASEVLCDRGWVKILVNELSIPKIQFIGKNLNRENLSLSYKQYKTAKSLCDKFNTPLNITNIKI